VIHHTAFSVKLFGDSAISVSRELTDDVLNAVPKISFLLLFPQRLLFGCMIIGAPG
jgi:hypothetical protein